MAWHSDNSNNMTIPVGRKKPNEIGLYDLSGNVWEWCEDIWHDNYINAPINSKAWLDGGKQNLRVVRGGSWGDNFKDCQTTHRDFRYPSQRYTFVGFRIAKNINSLPTTDY